MPASNCLCLIGFDRGLVGHLLLSMPHTNLRIGLLSHEEVGRAQRELDELGMFFEENAAWNIVRYDDGVHSVTLFKQYLHPDFAFTWRIFLGSVREVAVVCPGMNMGSQNELARCVSAYGTGVAIEFLDPHCRPQNQKQQGPRLVAVAAS